MQPGAQDRRASGNCIHCFFCQQKKSFFGKIFYICEKTRKKTKLNDTCPQFWGAPEEVIANRLNTWRYLLHTKPPAKRGV